MHIPLRFPVMSPYSSPLSNFLRRTFLMRLPHTQASDPSRPLAAWHFRSPLIAPVPQGCTGQYWPESKWLHPCYWPNSIIRYHWQAVVNQQPLSMFLRINLLISLMQIIPWSRPWGWKLKWMILCSQSQSNLNPNNSQGYTQSPWASVTVPCPEYIPHRAQPQELLMPIWEGESPLLVVMNWAYALSIK